MIKKKRYKSRFYLAIHCVNVHWGPEMYMHYFVLLMKKSSNKSSFSPIAVLSVCVRAHGRSLKGRTLTVFQVIHYYYYILAVISNDNCVHKV